MEELNNKYVGKFIGEDKVTDIDISEFLTSSGSMVFELTLENGKKEFLPEKGLVASITDEKSDATTMYGARLAAISADCIKAIEEYDLPSYLFDRVTAKIKLELDNHIERAASIAWFGTDKEYAPGFSTQGMVTLLGAERMNKRIPTKEDVK